jgi:hypothetical protein
MFRLRLHPTPSGFFAGIAVIALWALLWLWFIAQLVEGPRTAASRTLAPGLTEVESRTNSAT